MRYILCVLLVAVGTVAGDSSLQKTDPTDIVCEDGSTINIKKFFSSGERKKIEEVLEPNFEDWKTMLIEAPVSINLITNMIIISASITDETLEAYKPVEGWVYTRHPTSLRACLVQLGNDAWDAFEGAHRNMDEIQLNMLLVPGKVVKTLKMLKRFPMSLLKRTVPRVLDEISDIAIHCANKANDSYNVFHHVNGYIGELNEVVTAADGDSEIKVRQALIRLKTAQAKLAGQQKVEDFAQKDLDAAEKLVEEARESYSKAVDDIPSSWDLTKQELLKTVVKGAMAAVVGPMSLLGGLGGSSGEGGSGNVDSNQNTSTPGPQTNDLMIFAMMEAFPAQLEELKQLVDNAADASILEFEKWELTMEDTLAIVPDKIRTVIFDMAAKLVTDALKVAKEVSKQKDFLETGELSDAEKQKIMEKIEDLKLRFSQFQGIQPPEFTPPAAQTINQPQFKTPEAAKAYILSQGLKIQQESKDRKMETMIELKLALAEMQAKIANIDLTVADLKEVRKLLGEVLELLGQIKKSWAKLVFYFQICTETEKHHPYSLHPTSY